MRYPTPLMHPPCLRDSLPEYLPTAGGPALQAPRTILLADDDRSMVTTLVTYFEKKGFEVATSGNLAEAKAIYQRRLRWTLVMSDYHLCDGTGWDFYCWIRGQTTALPPFLLMSGSMNGTELSGEVQFIGKPFTLVELEARLQGLLGRNLG